MTDEQQRDYEKYCRIVTELEKIGITLIGVDNPMVVLSYKDKVLRHNIMTWQVFTEEKVIEFVKSSFFKDENHEKI